ncbi:MAG: ribonuclease III [Sphaerospermopsis sp. SIO1G2]|nr:ribonuclease III [Sphaerospermopsis sp. SIO1G2]
MRERFENPALFDLAMTHPSMHKARNNQRLEFLGDRVLGLVIADMIYTRFENAREGDMAKRLAALVCADTLARVARQIGLGEYMILSDSEAAGGGHETISNLEDCCEALIGALYLDGGLERAQDFIEPLWEPLLTRMITAPKDAKTSLQEWVQARGLPLPLYEEVAREGPAHAPHFTIAVSVQGHAPVSQVAPSKRAAEQLAAQTLLQQLQE